MSLNEPRPYYELAQLLRELESESGYRLETLREKLAEGLKE